MNIELWISLFTCSKHLVYKFVQSSRLLFGVNYHTFVFIIKKLNSMNQISHIFYQTVSLFVLLFKYFCIFFMYLQDCIEYIFLQLHGAKLNKVSFFSAISLKTLDHVIVDTAVDVLLMLMRKLLFIKTVFRFLLRLQRLILLLICIQKILLQLFAH